MLSIMSKLDQKLNNGIEHMIAEQGAIITLVPQVPSCISKKLLTRLSRTLSMRLDSIWKNTLNCLMAGH